MKRFFRTALLVMAIMMVCASTAFADSGQIVVSDDPSAVPVEIETDQQTIDIPIVVQGLSDVYAFSIDMTYAPEAVGVVSFSTGGIFSDFGSAVVKNDIDNDTGTAAYMQTILAADEGAMGGGVLCTVRLTLADGTFDIADDLGLQVQIANSVPEYIDAYVAPVKIIVGSQTGGDAQPTQSPEPQPTATVGVIEPDPDSGQAEDFELAEDESVEEIMAALEDIPEPDDAQAALGDETAAQADAPEPDAAAGADVVESDVSSIKPDGMNPAWYYAIGAAALVLAGGTAFWLWRRRKPKAGKKKAGGEYL